MVNKVIFIFLFAISISYNSNAIHAVGMDQAPIPKDANKGADNAGEDRDSNYNYPLSEVSKEEELKIPKANQSYIIETKAIVDGQSLLVNGYLQENSYYCGPAVVQNIMQAQTGKVYSQASLAAFMGTNANVGTGATSIRAALGKYVSQGYEVTSIYSKSVYDATREDVRGGYRLVYNVLTGTHLNKNYKFNSGHYLVGTGYSEASTGERTLEYFDAYYGSGGANTYRVPSYVITNAIKMNKSSPYFIW